MQKREIYNMLLIKMSLKSGFTFFSNSYSFCSVNIAQHMFTLAKVFVY